MAAYFDIRGTATKLIAATIGTLTILTTIIVSGSLRLSQQPSGRILYTESNGVVTTTPSLAYTSSTATVGVTNLNISGTCTGCGASLNPFVGHIVPTTNNAQDVGASTSSIRNIYASGTSQLVYVSSTAMSAPNANFTNATIGGISVPGGGSFGSSGIQANSISRVSPTPMTINGGETTDAATNVGVKIGSYRDFLTAGGQPIQFLDGSTIMGGFGYLGQFFVGTSSTGLGAATTTGIFNFGSAPTSTIQNGYSGRPSCMVYGDSDGSGLTYCTWNNGVQTCGTTSCT